MPRGDPRSIASDAAEFEESLAADEGHLIALAFSILGIPDMPTTPCRGRHRPPLASQRSH